MLCFKFKLPRQNKIIIGIMEKILISKSLFIILDCLDWILEEMEKRVFLTPWLDESSIHPFSPVEERIWEITNGVEIMFCVERLVRNHIDEEALRIIGVFINIGVRLGFVKNQAAVSPERITIGVRSFWAKGIIKGWLGVISIQFRALPPMIAAKVIKNIGVIIGESLSVRLEQGMECLGDHRINIIMRREYPAVSPVAKKAIRYTKELD